MTLVAGQAMLTIILTPAIEWHIHKIFSHNWQLCDTNVPIRSVILAKQPIYRLLYELHASNKQLLTHFGHQKCSIRPVDLIHRLQWRHGESKPNSIFVICAKIRLITWPWK